ncbi:hypothetical protein PUMCH_003428 [Australozyma saopauloensis]|uniref:Uncharacterized protein n=1 Tax=Australozyma saopauloensis TaxID=291208 RepID=A0AAX4HCJ3_9ASCO|nr:hypothetical protein PUMCH_003428 [[Candida] saopauloensis]
MDGDVHAGGCILTVHGEWAPVCSLWNTHCLGFVAGVQENYRLCGFLQAVHEAAWVRIQADGQIWETVLSLAGVTIVAVAIPPVSSPFAIVEAHLPIGKMGWSLQSMGRRDARLLEEKNRLVSMKRSAWGALRKASKIESVGGGPNGCGTIPVRSKVSAVPQYPRFFGTNDVGNCAIRIWAKYGHRYGRHWWTVAVDVQR